MSTTGKSWVLGVYSGASCVHVGGKPFDVKVSKELLSVEGEPVTGQRKVGNLAASGIYYVIDFKMKLQDLTDFIIAYCMPSAEGNGSDLSSFNLYVSDGTDSMGYTGCLVDTCTIDVGQGGKAAVATVRVLSIANESKSFTVTPSAHAPITKTGFSIKVGGTAKAKWRTISFTVKNNVEVAESGNGVACTENFPKHAIYNGSADWIKTATIAYGYSTTVKATIEITILDNNSVTKVFTFANAAGNSNNTAVQELNQTIENLEWTGDGLVIS